MRGRTRPQAQVADTALDVLVLRVIEVPVHVLRQSTTQVIYSAHAAGAMHTSCCGCKCC